MRSLVIILLLVVLAGGTSLTAKDLYKLIQAGRLAEVRDSLSQMATAATRDGDLIFFQSLIETDAERSAELMETALKSTLTHSYRQQVYYRLANYYLLKRDYPGLSRIVNSYRSDYESGAYEQEMMRLSILADELQGNLELAQRQADRYSVRFSKGVDSQWGRLDRARIMMANKKKVGAIRLLEKLSREKHGVGVPQSLYLLAQNAIKHSRTEDAVFYFNLLKEAYPAAIGLDALSVQLGALSNSYRTDNMAELITGTYYTVKVGVFTKKANAQGLKDLFESMGHTVSVQGKNISGRRYHVVYVGRFSDYEEAVALKKHLETTQGEVYQVISR